MIEKRLKFRLVVPEFRSFYLTAYSKFIEKYWKNPKKQGAIKKNTHLFLKPLPVSTKIGARNFSKNISISFNVQQFLFKGNKMDILDSLFPSAHATYLS
ncbi:hypothetical protein [Pedobacter sp. ASV28]|uniref:hypothetical protein n=1 Tax=Pedobacter sp. ASV28 TaxID=2795123 RepID=UPI0018EC7AEE|nr:hypothetical protein [Pedobacter sp. ASV28]